MNCKTVVAEIQEIFHGRARITTNFPPYHQQPSTQRMGRALLSNEGPPSSCGELCMRSRCHEVAQNPYNFLHN